MNNKKINKKFIYKKNNFLDNKTIPEKKINKNNYLYKNKKLKRGIFLKKPTLYEILYPVFLNLKLIKQYLKKK